MSKRIDELSGYIQSAEREMRIDTVDSVKRPEISGHGEEPRFQEEKGEGTEDVKYTELSIHLFAGASEKDTEAAMSTRRVEGIQQWRYRCRAITPLLRGTPRDVRRARCASVSRTLSTLRINQARERD